MHCHLNSNENANLICGKLVEVIYVNVGNEVERIHLNPTVGNFECVMFAGVWHTVEVLEPTVLYAARYGKYGEDGTETFEWYLLKKS